MTQAGLRCASCGSTKRSGRIRCGAEPSRISRSMSALRTSAMCRCSRYRSPPWMSLVLAEEVWAARSSCSQSRTESPRPAASRAIPAPLIPPPTIRTSYVPECCMSRSYRDPGARSDFTRRIPVPRPDVRMPARRARRRDGAGHSRYLEASLEHVRLERNGRLVLEDVTWSVRPGERWVLAGGNGAGKTQLLKIVAGSVWPTPTGRESRRYRWKGGLWRTPQEIQEQIAYVGPERQDKYTRYGWNYTVRQVVATGVQRTDIPLLSVSQADRKRVAAVLRRLRIEALADRRFLTLSYGERRLTLLARALASRPKMLLLDELLNGLDEFNHGRALRWLESTARSAMPWVLSTHRVEDIPAS